MEWLFIRSVPVQQIPMSPPSTSRQAADVDWCYDVLEDVSRTFAITIGELEEPLAREICVGYLLCRIADTVEDAAHIPAREQVALLETYREGITPGRDTTVAEFVDEVLVWAPESGSAEWELVAETSRVVSTFESLPEQSQRDIRPHVREMIDGMVLFIDRYSDEGGLRIGTVDELEEYCWYVAGTVGHLVTSLLTRDASAHVEDTLYENADSFGLLLQTVNITKDVREDYREENNIYVPEEVLARHGLGQCDFGESLTGDQFAPVVRDLVARAEEYVAEVREWLRTMPLTRGNMVSAWGIPFLLAVGTMRELRERPEDVVEEGEVKVDRDEVLALMQTFAGETPPIGAIERKVRAGSLAGPE
jgi:farnesyl-diphosphate farnesyltransferase